jgi:hypothetical protein
VQITRQHSSWQPISSEIADKTKSSPYLTIDQIQRSKFMHVDKNAPTPSSNTVHKTKKQIIDNKTRDKGGKNGSQLEYIL